MDSGSSGCVVGELHLTQVVCTPSFRHALDRQRICSVSMLGSEEQSSAPWKMRAFQGHRDVWREGNSGCVLQAPASTHCLPRVSVRLGREAKEYKKRHCTESSGGPVSTGLLVYEKLTVRTSEKPSECHILQPLTHVEQGCVQWFCPLSYRQQPKAAGEEKEDWCRAAASVFGNTQWDTPLLQSMHPFRAWESLGEFHGEVKSQYN